MSKEKRSPLLLDLVANLDHTKTIREETIPLGAIGQQILREEEPIILAQQEKTRAMLRAAKPFVFDFEASKAVGYFLSALPKMLIDNLEYAIPCFDVMWVEIDSNGLKEGMRKAYKKRAKKAGRTDIPVYMDMPVDLDYQADQKIGFLLNGLDVLSYVQAPDSEKIEKARLLRGESYAREASKQHIVAQECTKFVFNLERPKEQTEKLEELFEIYYKQLGGQIEKRFETLDDALKNFCLVNYVSEDLDEETIRRFTDCVQFPTLLNNTSSRAYNAMQSSLTIGAILMGSGLVGAIASALLLLNRPSPSMKIREVMASSTLKMLDPKTGKRFPTPRPLLKHNVVSIDLAPEEPESLISDYFERHGKKRFHEVRGHFCHDETFKANRMCDHQMDVVGQSQWMCSKCLGKRWFRRAHTRGDLEQGAVSHTQYSVVNPSAKKK